MRDLIVIGGGAAGMACAISAAERGLSVTVAERMDRVGKKLLATGNGRCNLMNTGAPRYPSGGEFAGHVLSRCGQQEQKAFWNHLGLMLRQEEGGRVYPASGQASTVLDALRTGMRISGVEVRTGFAAEEIRIANGAFSVIGNGEFLKARNLCVCGGGASQSKLGSDGSTLGLLRNLEVPCRPFRPVLTQVICDTTYTAGLSGIRVKGILSAADGSGEIHRESGEILFTDYGLSGVCTMNCSGYLPARGGELWLDLLPGLGIPDGETLERELVRRKTEWAGEQMDQLMNGLCVPRLAMALMKRTGIRAKDRTVGSLEIAEIHALTHACGHFVMTVKGLKGQDNAQVSRGGADPSAFSPDTMMCKKVPGLYAAGEVLDVDGECGGFNLMFAFGSGILAGKSVEG